MENISVLNQMAEYDFNSPIDVTMIFEDSDDDTTYKNVLREQCENIHDNNNKDGSPVEKCIPEIKVIKNNKNLNKNDNVNKSKHSKIPKTNLPVKPFCKTSEEIIILDIDDNLCNNGKTVVEPSNSTNDAERLHYEYEAISNQHPLIVRGGETQETEINVERAPVNRNHRIIDQDQVTTFIEDMLNKLSEHLIVIMQTFYHYRLKINTCDDTSQELRKREHIFNVLKFHFFELSYTTIESIILPKEQDVKFITRFLYNTALMANSKSLICHQKHVEPFFNEMVIWAKRKRAGIEAFKLKPSSSENFLLKRHLLRPPQPFKLQHSKNVPDSDKVPTSTTQNDLCIFSTGSPGSEISINITPDTLRNCTQYSNTVECTGNKDNYPSSGQPAPRITPPPSYEQNRNNYNQINYTNNNRHRQPVAGVCRLKKKNKTNYPMIQKIIHPIQNNQYIGQPIQNYSSQVHYVNSTETSPCDSGFLKSYHDNRNNNQMHGTQIENALVYSNPIITKIASLNTKYTTVRSRCFMCGKYTETISSNCNYPSYCSYLCQDLDNQFRKSTGGTT